MTTLPKTLLILSVAGFAVSLTGPGAEFACGVIKPLSAISFIVFYITQLLAKEVEAYDREQHAKLGWMHAGATVTGSGAASTNGRRSPSLAGAGAK
ncbi:MAG: hypothetical protein FJ398_09520 [Verrucomicrobia bacterium]|nr:hypothetical protein [Verrucomicrobiota bacterium]